MPEKQLTVGAIGVGPMGTILGGCLAEAGARIIVSDLPHRVEQVKKEGLQVRRAGRRFEYDVDTVDSIRELRDRNPDVIFIATKACILKHILPEVAEAASEDCLVISAQNGIGTEEEIARYISPENVARMVINYAAGNDEQGVAHVAWFNPPNFFGHLTEKREPRLARLVDMLNSLDVATDLVDAVTIKKRAFLKTVLNTALMPICALMGITMKQALDGRATRRLAEDLVREGLSVAARLGYDYGEDIQERCMGYLEGGGDHHPSMTADLREKRPSEIDFLNGKILEIGSRFEDLNLEVNRVLVSMIMEWEVRNGTRGPGDMPGYILGSRRKTQSV